MIDLGPLHGRVAGAPISWGVCEAPGWGYEQPPSVVLTEMAELGLPATELGPTGYLGPDPEAVRRTLAEHGLSLVGGFLPVTMHLAADADLEPAGAAMRTLAAAGGRQLVLAADAGPDGYQEKVRPTDAQWRNLLHNLERVRALADSLGLATTFHPHVGTAVESADVVERLLADSDVSVCLDTGHLAIGGVDPLELTREHPNRIGHVHLKDVRLAVAREVAAGTTGFLECVREGLFAPLGAGDLDIAGVVRLLEGAGYTGWYVLEQDTSLEGPPAAGTGPVEDVRRSLRFLAEVARGL